MPFEIVPAGTKIDFIGKRHLCAAISAALLLAGVVAIPIQGVRYGIDFAGGTEVQVLLRRRARAPTRARSATSSPPAACATPRSCATARPTPRSS